MTATNLEIVKSEIEITDQVQALIDRFDGNHDFIMELIRSECDDVDYATTALKERYKGKFEAYKDFVWDYVNDCVFEHNTPKVLKDYFDYEKYGRDLELGGDFYTIEVKWGEVHVFSGC